MECQRGGEEEEEELDKILNENNIKISVKTESKKRNFNEQKRPLFSLLYRAIDQDM